MARLRQINVLLAMALAQIGAGSAVAEEDSLYFGGMPTVYSASRMPQAQSETPNFVTIIDRDMIRASGARELSDLMRLVPGFQVASRGTEVPPRVAYHGLANDDYSPRLQVLIDGRSQYSGLFKGGVNWDLLPVAVEDIERIEVVRGSNVAAFGTNAFMGVVNVVTVDPSLAKGAALATSMGSNGVLDQYVRYGGQVGDTSFRLTFKGEEDHGNRFVKLPSNTDDPAAIANAWRKQLFDVRIGTSLSANDELSLRFGAMDGRFEVGRSDQVYPDPGGKMYNPPRVQGQSTRYVQVDWKRQLAAGDELLLRASSVEDQIDDSGLTGSNVFTIYGSGRSTRDSLELQYLQSIGTDLRLLSGIASQTEIIDHRFNFHEGSVSRQVYRLFSNLEWRVSHQWLLNVGGSWDHDSIAGAVFSPRVSASYEVAKGHTLRTGLVTAYRIPSLYEYQGWTHFGQVGVSDVAQTAYKADGQIKPEKMRGYEVGYLGELPSLASTVDLRLFSEHVSDRVQVVSQKPVNLENIRITGAEYQLQWRPLETTRVILGQSLVTLRSEINDANETDYQKQTESSAPRIASSMMLMQSLNKDTQASVMVYQVDKTRWSKAGNLIAPAYTRVDWRLAKRFVVGSTAGEIAYVVQSEQGTHPELNATNMVLPRQWVTVRLEL